MVNHKFLEQTVHTHENTTFLSQLWTLLDKERIPYAIVRLDLLDTCCFLHIDFWHMNKTNLKNAIFDIAEFAAPQILDIYEYDGMFLHSNQDKLVRLMTNNRISKLDDQYDGTSLWFMPDGEIEDVLRARIE